MGVVHIEPDVSGETRSALLPAYLGFFLGLRFYAKVGNILLRNDGISLKHNGGATKKNHTVHSHRCENLMSNVYKDISAIKFYMYLLSPPHCSHIRSS
jgi:hypothetical protein